MVRFPPQGVVVVVWTDEEVAAAGEVLYSEGKKTVSEVAFALNAIATATAARELGGYSDAFAASVLNDASLTVAKAASILADSNLPVEKAASIVNHTNLATAKAASIFNHTNLTLDRAYAILAHANLSATKMEDILGHGNIDVDRVQSILYDAVVDHEAAEVASIITKSGSDHTVSADETVTDIVRYKDLTINSGVTLTVDGQPGVIIAREIANDGTVSKTFEGGAGGAAGADGTGVGGQGGGGLIVCSGIIRGLGVFQADGQAAAAGTTVTASANGHAGGAGAMNRVGTDSPGNGGEALSLCGGGYIPSGGTPGGGGAGNGGPNEGGAGAGITLTTKDSYAVIFEETWKAAVDWYIVNVLTRTPTSTINFYNCTGAGGGGGGACDGSGAGGGGGGSGGYILAVVNSACGPTFRARGGAGGDGGTEGGYDGAGGGGGGGLVYVLYHEFADVTFDVSGGAGATGGDCAGGDGDDGHGSTHAV